ncbi:MAG: tol-pal system-associated acyl-CoA thioesterase [Hyphomicrobium sp.]
MSGEVGMSNGRDVRKDGVHVFVVRVYFEDTDATGIVYNANYLKFAERARTEMLREFGLEHSQMIGEEGRAFAVRRCIAEFMKPARLDDLLEVHTRLLAVSGASLELAQDVKRQGVILVTLRFGLACISVSGRATRIPPALRTTLANLWQQNGLSD